jgi:ferredoxin-NADP reductase/Na+-translocating ferredoxin:NAD+ oxidoreductase RnfD subunit
MLSYLDGLLDRITMYKLLFYYLIALVGIAFLLSIFGILHFSPMSIAATTAILVVSCYVVNKVFAAILHAPTNSESTYITALILALIISPVSGFQTVNIGFLLAASGLSMASKYVITYRRKHIFNPAAIAVALTAIGPHQSASWWIGTTVMLPYVVIGGLLLVRKIRRGRMVFTFFGSALVSTVIFTLITKGNVLSVLDKTVLTSSLFFLGFVMLTEPLTTPPTAKKQTLYALLAGILFPPQVHIFSYYSTPELDLIISNAFSFLISPKAKLLPTLTQKVRIAPDSADFVFKPNIRFKYEPGQYMEWTLPHRKTDSRGNRRFFTLASSPTEKDIRIGVKFYKHGSSFKDALLAMDSKTPISASQIAGDFTLPKKTNQKIAFIAGGIGITPYRSMIKYLIDTDQQRSISMLYSAKTNADFAYKDVFEQARQKLGVNTIYTITHQKDAVLSDPYTRIGYINADAISREIPDYLERMFYISGTHSMVEAVKSTLGDLGVPNSQIKVDFFSGYA